jgi:hypothetical protein
LGGGLNPETTFQVLLMARSEIGIGAMWQHLTANLAAVALFVSGWNYVQPWLEGRSQKFRLHHGLGRSGLHAVDRRG